MNNPGVNGSTGYLLHSSDVEWVNALIMGPAGYQVADFMKSGGIMTVLFLMVTMVMMNLVF